MPEASGGTCLTSSFAGCGSGLGIGSTTVVVSGSGGLGGGACWASAVEAVKPAITLKPTRSGRHFPCIRPPAAGAAILLLAMHGLRQAAVLQRRGERWVRR